MNITFEFYIFKLEENNYILFSGGDALVYLAKSMHKNAPQHLFGATHLVGRYVLGLMTDTKICW